MSSQSSDKTDKSWNRRSFLKSIPLALGFPYILTSSGQAHSTGQRKSKLPLDEKPISAEKLLEKVPRPVLPSRPDLVNMYDKCWVLGLENSDLGTEENGFVDWFIDEGFDERIFQWDTCFALAWAKYSQGGLPNIESLDNFYNAQNPDGAIDGVIGAGGENTHSKDAINFTRNPLFAWSEYEYYQVTGDDSRIERVLPILKNYSRWVRKHRRRRNGHFYWSGLSSGMDNSPRTKARGFYPPWGFVDYNGNMALSAWYMIRLARLTGDRETEQEFQQLHDELKTLVNRDMWSEEDQIYWDIDRDGSFLKTKTVASFWPLWGRIAEPRHVEGLVRHLNDPRSFNRPHRIPTTAADEDAYHPEGYYWQGSVWAPTNHMIVKGLEANGEHKLAREIVQNHINNQSIVFRDQETVYENYSPEYVRPGQPWSRSDFVGWSADGPIAQLIEHYIGIKPDVPNNKIRWDLLTIEEVGLENLKLGDATLSLKASEREAPDDPVELTLQTDQPYTLELHTEYNTYLKRITPGTHNVTFQNPSNS